jgi:hypothetical protein
LVCELAEESEYDELDDLSEEELKVEPRNISSTKEFCGCESTCDLGVQVPSSLKKSDLWVRFTLSHYFKRQRIVHEQKKRVWC